jgi:hypothetical protein
VSRNPIHPIQNLSNSHNPKIHDNRLNVFENREPKKIFGLKRDGVVRGWRKLQNEELVTCNSQQIV